MTTGIAHFAQEDFPNIDYTAVTPEQADIAVRVGATLDGYEVALLPIDIPETALATAEEYAAHRQAKRDADARKIGAVFFWSSATELSPEDHAVQLHRERSCRLFMRVRMPQGASMYELFRGYYDSALGPEPGS